MGGSEGFLGVGGLRPTLYLWDGQREVAEHLEGGGAVAAGLALEAALQLPHKEIWGAKRGSGGAPPEVLGSRGGGDTPIPSAHPRSCCPPSPGSASTSGWRVRRRCRGGDTGGGGGQLSPKPGLPFPTSPPPPHLSVSGSSRAGGLRVSDRMLGVRRPFLLISTCSRSMKNLRNSCASCWLRAQGHFVPTPGGGPRGAPRRFWGGVSPVAREGGDVFLEHGLEAPGVDGLGGVGVPESGDDIGEGCGDTAVSVPRGGLCNTLGGAAGVLGGSVPPSVSSWGARGPGGCSCWKSRRRQ